MENMDDYFSDINRTEFISGDAIMTTLREWISDSIKEEATETKKPERIEQIVNSLPILFRHMIQVNGINQTREIKIKNATKLREALFTGNQNYSQEVSRSHIEVFCIDYYTHKHINIKSNFKDYELGF
jgi:hypothetical protein